MSKQYNKNDPYLKTLPYDAGYTLKFGHYKIRSCPFCGNKPWTGGIRDFISVDWTIECRNCKISLVYSKTHLGGFNSKKHLVDHWNGVFAGHDGGKNGDKS